MNLLNLFQPKQREDRLAGQLGQRSVSDAHPMVHVLENDVVDAIAPGAMDMTQPDCVAFSATEWLRIWYVRRWPREMSADRWAELLHFPGDVRVSLFMEPLASGLVVKQLERQETAIQSSRLLRQYQHRDPSPSEDKRYDEIKEERQLIEVNNDPFYYFTVVLGLFADSEEHLSKWSAELESQCQNMSLVIERARWQQEDGLLALLPHNLNALGNHRRNARVDSLVNTFPFLGDEIVMPGGIFYGYDTQTSKAIVLDPFKLENPNCIILGTSGGGKSYWTKDMIEQYVLDGARVFVLDIENEYRHLCNDLGGLYLDMGIESESKVNVLDPDPNDSDGLPGAFESFKGWLVACLRHELAPEEEQVLDKAYYKAFAQCGIFKEHRDSIHKQPPLLSDLHDALIEVSKDEVHSMEARRLAAALYPMSHGMSSAAFNCHTNVDVRSNPLVVFGLSSVHRSMMTKRIRQIQQFTWSQMTQADRAIEIVDEAWWLLQRPETAEDLCARARRFRKKNAALFIATQHPEDFAANREAHTILSLVGTHLLFQQNDAVLDDIAGIFKLNEQEKWAVARLEPGHYFLKTSKLRMLLYRPMLKSRHGLYTTRPEEMMKG